MRAPLIRFGILLSLSASALAGELRGRVTSRGRPVAGAKVAATASESPHDAARREATVPAKRWTVCSTMSNIAKLVWVLASQTR